MDKTFKVRRKDLSCLFLVTEKTWKTRYLSSAIDRQVQQEISLRPLVGSGYKVLIFNLNGDCALFRTYVTVCLIHSFKFHVQSQWLFIPIFPGATHRLSIDYP